MSYIITSVRILDGEYMAPAPGGNIETTSGCESGTLLEVTSAESASMISAGQATEGPPDQAPVTDEERAALIDGKPFAFVNACEILGYV